MYRGFTRSRYLIDPLELITHLHNIKGDRSHVAPLMHDMYRGFTRLRYLIDPFELITHLHNIKGDRSHVAPLMHDNSHFVRSFYNIKKVG